MAKKRPYKFLTSKTSIILSLIIVVISLIFIFFLSLEINNVEEIAVPVSIGIDESDGDNFYSYQLYQDNLEKKVLLSSLKDVLVVICSILGTNLIVSLIIQKKSQNDMYDEFLTEDLLQNTKFLKSMEKEKRQTLLRSIEKIDYMGCNEIYSELVNNVRNKIINSDYKFYYISNKIDIICNKKSNYIEKEIIKTVEIRSFDKEYTAKDYIITKFALEKINTIKNVEIKKLVINGQTQNVNVENENCDIKFVNMQNDDNVYYDNVNYNEKGQCCLKKEITFYDNETTTIEVTYITRVPVTDKVYTSRLSVPCKRFHFHFRIDDSKTNYKIHAQAFGFQDDAMKNPAGSRKNEVTYEISDWAFPSDGVFVAFYK